MELNNTAKACILSEKWVVLMMEKDVTTVNALVWHNKLGHARTVRSIMEEA